MNFERTKDVLKTTNIGRWKNHTEIIYANILGTIGYLHLTDHINYKLHGIELKDYLSMTEKFGSYSSEALDIVSKYAIGVFYGSKIVKNKKYKDLDEKYIRFNLWSLDLVCKNRNNYRMDIRMNSGKNIVYEKDIFTIKNE